MGEGGEPALTVVRWSSSGTVWGVSDLELLPERLASLVSQWVLNERDRGRPADLFGGGGGDDRFAEAVYVGRSFAGRVGVGFGNPVPLQPGAARRSTLVKYFEWVQGPSREARYLRTRIRAGELTGRPLSCWCHPSACHAWLLCGWANSAAADVEVWVERLRAGH